MRGRSYARVDASAVSPVAACKSSASVDDVSSPINWGYDVCEAVTGAFDGACDCAQDGSVPTCSRHPAAAAASPLLIRRSSSAIILFRCWFLSCLSLYEHSIFCDGSVSVLNGPALELGRAPVGGRFRLRSPGLTKIFFAK